jgi:hypothetical protein
VVQVEVEVDRSERLRQALGVDLGRIADAGHRRHQAFAAGKGKVVPQVFVAVDVDLGGQLAVLRRADEEVDVRRAAAVAAQQVQKLLGGAVRRAAVADRDDAAELVAAVFVGDDGAARLKADWLGSKWE